MSTAKAQERMAEEISLLRQLLALATAKKEALFENNLEALREIVDEEEQTLAVVDRFQRVDDGEARESTEFHDFIQERAAILAELKEINLLNQQLLEDALAVVEYSLKLIHGEEENNLYGSSGQVKVGGNQSVVNWRG
ncbi:MAG TPA: flagellar protein FlgN [Firmicutes bacterium]|nr:flagellar protein FlgN [Bacillota bacterium]